MSWEGGLLAEVAARQEAAAALRADRRRRHWSVAEAALVLGIDPSRVRRILNAPEPLRPHALPDLTGRQLSGVWLVDRASVERRLDAMHEASAAARGGRR